jgi:hypothetical protein
MCGHAGSQLLGFFASTNFLACLVGYNNDFNMTILKPSEVDLDNVINVTMEDLNDTQKQLL